ncbi:MAG: 4Fe-4S binding protein [Bacillota bacterium]|nr:4Fe-4S binding protein [Bacillota bacterium]
MLADSNQDASQCVGCGACEAACPQRLPIIERLREVHAALSTDFQLPVE